MRKIVAASAWAGTSFFLASPHTTAPATASEMMAASEGIKSTGKLERPVPSWWKRKLLVSMGSAVIPAMPARCSSARTNVGRMSRLDAMRERDDPAAIPRRGSASASAAATAPRAILLRHRMVSVAMPTMSNTTKLRRYPQYEKRVNTIAIASVVRFRLFAYASHVSNTNRNQITPSVTGNVIEPPI